MQRTHQSIEEISSEEWDSTFRTNVYAMFWLCKAAIPHMKPGAAIVNTSSINATDPSPSLLAYATTKGAIANFTAGLAQLVAKQGIRVNAIALVEFIHSSDPIEEERHEGRPVLDVIVEEVCAMIGSAEPRPVRPSPTRSGEP